jgi:hypothetical protein
VNGKEVAILLRYRILSAKGNLRSPELYRRLTVNDVVIDLGI